MTELCEEDRMELMIARTVVPRLSGIEAKLDVFTATMGQVSINLAEEKAENRQTRKDSQIKLESIEAILNGNGKDGLVAVVNKLKEWSDDQKKIQFTIIGAVIVEIVGLVLMLLFK